MNLPTKTNISYFVALTSLIFSLLGFSYNAWRLEVSEDNSNIRTASFTVLEKLSELEQVVYFAYYDKNKVAGNPRKGWVKVILINDLCSLISNDAQKSTETLKNVWGNNWRYIENEQESVEKIVNSIDDVREKIKMRLKELK